MWVMALSCCKNLSSLFRWLTSKHGGIFYCLNCLYLFKTKNKLEKQEYCYIEIAEKVKKYIKT